MLEEIERTRQRTWPHRASPMVFHVVKLEFDYEDFMEVFNVLYVFFGLETCPNTQRLHHQGWCYFKNPQSSTDNVGKMLDKCHVELCNGSAEQNTTYCEKDGVVAEFGEEPAQCARLDLKALFVEMDHGKTVDQIMEEQPDKVHHYRRVLDRKSAVLQRKKIRTWTTTCEWCYVATCTGKTYSWKKLWDTVKMWVYVLNYKGWCDGYRGQPFVIIDELKPGDIPYRELLDMIDGCPHWLPNRWKEPTNFLVKHIYITSSLLPGEVYWDLPCNDKAEQLMDRIQIRHFTGPSKPRDSRRYPPLMRPIQQSSFSMERDRVTEDRCRNVQHVRQSLHPRSSIAWTSYSHATWLIVYGEPPLL